MVTLGTPGGMGTRTDPVGSDRAAKLIVPVRSLITSGSVCEEQDAGWNHAAGEISRRPRLTFHPPPTRNPCSRPRTPGAAASRPEAHAPPGDAP